MTPWDRATLALHLLAIDPMGLGGLVARARVSPARGALMDIAAQMPMPTVRLNAQATAQTLDGEIDLTATLKGNVLVMQKGLLDRDPTLFVLPMAERVSPYLAARLGQSLDARQGHAFIALDEGADDDEILPAALSDRAAFHIALDGIALGDLGAAQLPDDLATIRKNARRVAIPTEIPEQLVVLAVSLGIASLRAPSFALRAAQAHAALNRRDTLNADDLTVAVDLVFAHRATRLPETDPPDQDDEPDQPEDQPQTDQNDDLVIPDDMLLDAVKTALPADLLTKLDTGTVRKGHGGAGSGAKRTGNRKGRPLPARQGPKASSARVDLIATLRAAIPWQTLRKRADPARTGPIIQSTDLRHKRYQSLSDRLLIFTVDASGSAAMARLAEAKGAVELLLAQAYARRDHVALISFRGTEADVLLSPTRSLVQTKRQLAALPGGGGTPLASGLSAAITLAETAKGKGLTPTIVLLTDGRANIALDGTPNRAHAADDAKHIAGNILAAGIEAIVIDTTVRPEKALKDLANRMQATYVTLPRADAQSMMAAVTSTLKD